ncbi:MAG: hypothetical protein AB7F65_00845 [Dehalococcoidia bacterium]
MNEYVREEYQTLAPGIDVHDEAGQSVGTIGDTVGDYVELRGADLVTSYWIRRSEFGEARREAVLLGFPSDEIDERALAQPPQTREQANESGALSDERGRQREMMLEDLAEQRAEMRAEGRATDEADDNVGIPVEEELEQRHDG